MSKYYDPKQLPKENELINFIYGVKGTGEKYYENKKKEKLIKRIKKLKKLYDKGLKAMPIINYGKESRF